MAYSNTKKDKTQILTAEFAKKLGIQALLIFVTLSSIINIIRQIQTLRSARNRNDKLQEKIMNLEAENLRLDEKIKEATRSTNVDRKQREYFGRGKETDYWLTLPPEDIYPTIKPTKTPEERAPNIIQWWNLFTR